jgi:hypothetical protein
MVGRDRGEKRDRRIAELDARLREQSQANEPKPDRASRETLRRASLDLKPDARFRRARCCSLAADEAEAELVDAAGAVAGGEEVQPVDHVVVAAYEGLIDPCPLQDRQFERSFQEPPAPARRQQILRCCR